MKALARHGPFFSKKAKKYTKKLQSSVKKVFTRHATKAKKAIKSARKTVRKHVKRAHKAVKKFFSWKRLAQEEAMTQAELL
jgi:ElaB/YqjD/DUF883 family membrane-anchored ribosome-binding protein